MAVRCGGSQPALLAPRLRRVLAHSIWDGLFYSMRSAPSDSDVRFTPGVPLKTYMLS